MTDSSPLPDMPVEGCKLYCNQPRCLTLKGNRMYSMKIETYRKHIKDVHPQFYDQLFGAVSESIQVKSPLVLTKSTTREELKKNADRIKTKKGILEMFDECLDDEDLRVRIYYYATKCYDIYLNRLQIHQMDKMGPMSETLQMESVRQSVYSKAGEAIKSNLSELDHLSQEVGSLKIDKKVVKQSKQQEAKKPLYLSSESSEESSDEEEEEVAMLDEEEEKPKKKKVNPFKLDLGPSRAYKSSDGKKQQKKKPLSGGGGGFDLPFALGKSSPQCDSDEDSEACLDNYY